MQRSAEHVLQLASKLLLRVAYLDPSGILISLIFSLIYHDRHISTIVVPTPIVNFEAIDRFKVYQTRFEAAADNIVRHVVSSLNYPLSYARDSLLWV